MSASLLYTSSTGARELTPRFEKRAGVWVTVRRWRGLKAELLAIADGLSDPEATCTQEDDVWWLLESTESGRLDDPDAEPPSLDSQIVTVWGMPSSKLAKSIWELPKVKAEFDIAVAYGTVNGVTGPERAARIRADLLALARGEDVSYQIEDGVENGKEATPRSIKVTLDGVLALVGEIGMNRTVIGELFVDLSRDVQSYIVDAFTLRKRSVAPNGANLGPSYANTNRAFTTASLLAAEPSIPTTIRTGMPDGYWMKSAPVVDQTDATRFEVVQEWVHADDYSRFLYGAPL